MLLARIRNYKECEKIWTEERGFKTLEERDNYLYEMQDDVNYSVLNYWPPQELTKKHNEFYSPMREWSDLEMDIYL